MNKMGSKAPFLSLSQSHQRLEIETVYNFNTISLISTHYRVNESVCESGKAIKVVKLVEDNPYYHYSAQLCLALQFTGALSSYFTFPFMKNPNEGSRGIGKFHAESELACTQQCDRDNSCYKALFYQALNGCSTYQKKEIRFSEIEKTKKTKNKNLGDDKSKKCR